MAKVLIVYGTKEGHTATIVERMRSVLEERGLTVLVERARRTPPLIPADTDGVLVGASVHAETHQDAVKAFVRSNRSRLEELPSGFFQVCLTAADPTLEAAEATERMLEEFQTDTEWRPAVTATFAGMLAWTQYGLFTRTLMRLILRHQRLPPDELDRSHDVDYTDYESVERFAEAFAERLEPR